MDNIKYVLIVSQYYYSHHCFVVSGEEENFREKALLLIEKLEDYKRENNKGLPYHYGRGRSEAYTNISYRWNVNDEGDIYFIPCGSLTDAMIVAEEYSTELNKLKMCKGVKAARRREIEKAIDNHHLYSRIRDIVYSIFKVL